jgi:multiple sugar transport system substrate-binding protein
MLRKSLWTLFFLLTLLLATCTHQTIEPTSDVQTRDRPLTIWWNQGYFAQENQSIETIVADWHQKSNSPVSLEIISEDDIDKLTIAALKAGNPPDLVFSMRTDSALTERWAWDGKLADVSDVLEPLRDLYNPTALNSVYMYNKKLEKFAYYAIPFKQSSVHLHYWRDLLAEAGFTAANIPQEWDAFWQFWQQVQDSLQAQGKKVYGLALPMGTEATNDTFYGFEQFLEAYNVKLIDEKGQLQLDNPEVRQGLINTLEWVTRFYQEGYVPPESINWRGSDNNIAFLNKTAILVDNTTMSIPASQQKDKEIYVNQMATTEFPQKQNGEPMTYLVAIKQILLFAESQHQQAAKDFLSYFLQPEILIDYFQNAAGRWYPVMPILWQNAFWWDAVDPHVSVAAKQLRDNPTRPLNRVINPAYSEVHRENIWGQTMERIVVDGLSSEAAADEAIEKIETIFAQWGELNSSR